MLYYITLVLVFWALIYTAARFLQYYRIVKNYKEETQARGEKFRSSCSSGTGGAVSGGEQSRNPLLCGRKRRCAYCYCRRRAEKDYVRLSGSNYPGDRDLCGDLADTAVVSGGRYG